MCVCFKGSLTPISVKSQFTQITIKVHSGYFCTWVSVQSNKFENVSGLFSCKLHKQPEGSSVWSVWHPVVMNVSLQFLQTELVFGHFPRQVLRPRAGASSDHLEQSEGLCSTCSCCCSTSLFTLYLPNVFCFYQIVCYLFNMRFVSFHLQT